MEIRHRTVTPDALYQALSQTWNAIGFDVEEGFRSMRQRLTNVAAYEAILEHVSMYGIDRPEQKVAVTAFKLLSWEQQMRKIRKLLGRLV
jgi:hypothetical protein